MAYLVKIAEDEYWEHYRNPVTGDYAQDLYNVGYQQGSLHMLTELRRVQVEAQKAE
jgi:hypothetical protein